MYVLRDHAHRRFVILHLEIFTWLKNKLTGQILSHKILNCKIDCLQSKFYHRKLRLSYRRYFFEITKHVYKCSIDFTIPTIHLNPGDFNPWEPSWGWILLHFLVIKKLSQSVIRSSRNVVQSKLFVIFFQQKWFF